MGSALIWAVVILAVASNAAILTLVWRQRRDRQRLGADAYAEQRAKTEVDAPAVGGNMFDEFDRQVREDARTPVEVPTAETVARLTQANQEKGK